MQGPFRIIDRAADGLSDVVLERVVAKLERGPAACVTNIVLLHYPATTTFAPFTRLEDKMSELRTLELAFATPDATGARRHGDGHPGPLKGFP